MFAARHPYKLKSVSKIHWSKVIQQVKLKTFMAGDLK